MKTIQRSELQSEYSKIIAGATKFFPSEYIAHGTMTECNFGGLLITLDNSGESCIIVRDYGENIISISEVLEITYEEPGEEPETSDPDELQAGFNLGSSFITLNDFVVI